MEKFLIFVILAICAASLGYLLGQVIVWLVLR